MFFQVDSYGILLEVVQILTDLDLRIIKAYISSDGGWFMDGKYKAEAHIRFHLSLRRFKHRKSSPNYFILFSLGSLLRYRWPWKESEIQ
jgi:hypothetical protein